MILHQKAGVRTEKLFYLMLHKDSSKEHKKRIETVIDYILKNINDDVSLQTLAEVANYSPFHLQKLFKQVIGESPKQYILKVRLETALLLMIIHPHKPVKEVSIDCGFSSPSVFSRAVKNYFGISPEKIRTHSPKERMKIETSHRISIRELDIQIKKVEKIRGFYLIAPCDNMTKIQQSFREIMQIAITNDLLFDYKKIYGIHIPHQGNIYKAFFALNEHQRLSTRFNVTEIKAGKYATFKISGNIKETMEPGHFLYNSWLPENGYKIADIVRFEVFTENPATTPYNELKREVYIPIEPL